MAVVSVGAPEAGRAEADLAASAVEAAAVAELAEAGEARAERDSQWQKRTEN